MYFKCKSYLKKQLYFKALKFLKQGALVKSMKLLTAYFLVFPESWSSCNQIAYKILIKKKYQIWAT